MKIQSQYPPLLPFRATFDGEVTSETFTSTQVNVGGKLSVFGTGGIGTTNPVEIEQAQIAFRGEQGGDAKITYSEAGSGQGNLFVGFPNTDEPRIHFDEGSSAMTLRADGGFTIDDGSNNTAPLAGVVVSGSTPSGDYPDGTIWIQTT